LIGQPENTVMQIRIAQPDDMDAILRMGQAFHSETCYAPLIPFDAETVAATVAHLATTPGGVVYLAETDQGEVVGMAAAQASRHWFNANCLIAQEMWWWVDHQARGGRAALGLISALEKWAGEFGCDLLYMASTANIEPEKMARLYQRRGYVPQDIFYTKVLPKCQVH
jgi:GNAT superfamily N-acetyltransferase